MLRERIVNTRGRVCSPDKMRLNHPLQRTGAEHFNLMSHRFYNMIGFGRAAQIQERNENVV